jgi:hypothetical protein
MASKGKRKVVSGVGSKRPVLAQDAHLYPYLSKFGGVKNYGKQEPHNNFDKDVHY